MTREAYYKQQWQKSRELIIQIISKLPASEMTPQILASYAELLGEYVKSHKQDHPSQAEAPTFKGPN